MARDCLVAERLANVRRTGSWTWFDHIYKNNIVLVCCPAAQITKRVRSVLPEDSANEVLESGFGNASGVMGRFCGVRHDSSGCIAVFWLNPIADAPVVAHEALHAVYWLMKEKGLTLNDESQEAYTYYLEWLLREMSARADKKVRA